MRAVKVRFADDGGGAPSAEAAMVAGSSIDDQTGRDGRESVHLLLIQRRDPTRDPDEETAMLLKIVAVHDAGKNLQPDIV